MTTEQLQTIIENAFEARDGVGPETGGEVATAQCPGEQACQGLQDLVAILVAVFFICFVLYYFVNWKYLSELWLFN